MWGHWPPEADALPEGAFDGMVPLGPSTRLLALAPPGTVASDTSDSFWAATGRLATLASLAGRTPVIPTADCSRSPWITRETDPTYAYTAHSGSPGVKVGRPALRRQATTAGPLGSPVCYPLPADDREECTESKAVLACDLPRAEALWHPASASTSGDGPGRSVGERTVPISKLLKLKAEAQLGAILEAFAALEGERVVYVDASDLPPLGESDVIKGPGVDEQLVIKRLKNAERLRAACGFKL